MKIKPEHVAIMKTAIDNVLLENPGIVADYETGNFPRSDYVKNLQTRFCFDLGYKARLSSFYCTTLYTYANDTHIFTALKSICPKVTRKY